MAHPLPVETGCKSKNCLDEPGPNPLKLPA